jgi:hypothetical protein
MTARKENSIKDLSESYLEASKDEMVCVYDRYAGYVDGAEMVLNKIEDLAKGAYFYSDSSTKTRFLRNVEELIKELKGE